MSKYLVRFCNQQDYREIPVSAMIQMTEGEKIWRQGTVLDLLERGFEVGTTKAWFKKGEK